MNKIYDDWDCATKFGPFEKVVKWGGSGGCGFDLWINKDGKRQKRWIDLDLRFNIVRSVKIPGFIGSTDDTDANNILEKIKNSQKGPDCLIKLFPQGCYLSENAIERVPLIATPVAGPGEVAVATGEGPGPVPEAGSEGPVPGPVPEVVPVPGPVPEAGPEVPGEVAEVPGEGPGDESILVKGEKREVEPEKEKREVAQGGAYRKSKRTNKRKSKRTNNRKSKRTIKRNSKTANKKNQKTQKK
jgi:hypothetical protein